MCINFVEQFKHFWKVMLVLVIILNLVFVCTLAIGNLFSIPMEYLLEDPASLYGFNKYVGFNTTIGLLVLACGIGAVALLLFFIKEMNFNKKELACVVVMGLMSLFIFMDDAFLLHECAFTGLLHVGERYIFLLYFLAFGIFLLYFRREILSDGISFLMIAVLMFGLSISMDTLMDKNVLKDNLAATAEMLEEYFKLGGYLFWTAFVVLRAKLLILAGLNRD